MSDLVYVVVVRGPVPAGLAHRVTDAHVESIRSQQRRKTRTPIKAASTTPEPI